MIFFANILESEALQRSGPPPQTHVAGKPCDQILIVEDDLFFQVFLIDAIRKMHPGTRLTVCDTLEHARAELKRVGEGASVPYDLIIADHFLPDGLGMALFWNTAVRRNASRFVLTSGLDRSEFLRECRKFGVRDRPIYISKQQPFAMLRKRIGRILSES